MLKGFFFYDVKIMASLYAVSVNNSPSPKKLPIFDSLSFSVVITNY